ncbi:galactitol-1-phosphate 5-dehydrogenase [Paenibacillus sp. LHD-117]|uniref:zinc-dependent alcohol dehydrogenase n=1 Tax=Paenibacillus sp. LHD-117 TaxID=3071412 RepID=UPI0027E1D1AA|nr:galactitol-1-phosphate 5-dehydrogenase [Paenibacillus sp. LHD-117]MDQ6419715.1 galactitol-1-phosphate 5-dehydrogenase [Paenibacillus sp. LHD-117]
MKTAVWSAPEHIRIEERDIPEPGPGEVLLRIQSVGICGSELEGYLGHNSLRVPPLVMGHETCGIVERNGAGADRYVPGQKAVVNPLLYCGLCRSCRNGYTQLCEKRQIIGVHRPGAFAEFAVVPEGALVAVSAELNPFRASLAEPLACSLRATRRAMVRHPLAAVVVFGAGGIGMLCAMAARILGASEVLIADTNTERLEMVRRLGFRLTANPREESLESVVRAAFNGKGTDVVVDAAGFQPTRETAIRLVNPGGTFMNIGLGIDETELPINYLIRSEIELLGSFCYTARDFADAVELLEQGKITEEGWTEIRPLDEADAAFRNLVQGKVSSGKIFLQPVKEEHDHG